MIRAHSTGLLKITIASAIVSTLLLVFSALLWSLVSAAASVPSTGGPDSTPPASFYSAGRFAYLSLVAGVFSLFVSVGASGWIADRKLGIATTAGVVVVGLGVLLVLDWAAQF